MFLADEALGLTGSALPVACFTPMTTPDAIIVIAASLGGLDAVCELLQPLPSDLQASIVVVLHTHASSPRFLAHIIGQNAALRTSYAEEGGKLKAGRAYIAPPDFHLMVTPQKGLHLNHGPKVGFHRPSADVLFKSAAHAFGERVIVVVLTGGDSDGTQGLKEIHAAGGLSVIQDPSEAVAPSMPQSAVAGDHPDFVVKLADMPALLCRLVEGGPMSNA